MSLRWPHAESDAVGLGVDDWSANLPAEEELEKLLDPTAGRRVRWRSGVGWTTVED